MAWKDGSKVPSMKTDQEVEGAGLAEMVEPERKWRELGGLTGSKYGDYRRNSGV